MDEKWSDEHDTSDEPICPYCNTKDEEWWDGGLGSAHDGDSAIQWCGECNKKYKTTLYVSYCFSTRPLKEGENV